MEKLILASASPRRRELLARLGVPFTVKPSPIDEGALSLSGTPARQATDSAAAKAGAAAEMDKDCWILAADTIVVVDDAILGKPGSREEARGMLALLSGRSHTVFTGVCLSRYGGAYPPPVCEETKVWMTRLSERQIEDYLDSGESMDKAGAYGIQYFGGSLIPRIEGCYFNVMGLPLYRTARLLEEAGFRLNPAGVGAEVSHE
jgi:septum formation protein